MPVPPPASQNAVSSSFKPDSGYNTSGGLEGPGMTGTAWWNIDTQSFNSRHRRITEIEGSNKFFGSGTPSYNIENYVECDYTVQTRRDVKYADFSSTIYQEQDITVFSDSTSGGFGLSGGIYTVVGGYKRYKSKLDANGKPEDSSEVCTRGETLELQRNFGYYDPTTDTSATIRDEINNMLNSARTLCPVFDPNLVRY